MARKMVAKKDYYYWSGVCVECGVEQDLSSEKKHHREGPDEIERIPCSECHTEMEYHLINEKEAAALISSGRF